LRGKVNSTTPVTKNTIPKNDTVKKTNPVTVIKKPVNKPVVKTNTPIIKKTNTTNKPIVKTNTTTAKINIPARTKIDSTQKIQLSEVKTTPPKTFAVTPDALKNRANELVKTLIVNDPDVIVKLYDNGEIDDDTISVYMDKKLVLAAKRLTASPLVVKLKMDEDNAEHELVMVAENLGRIPPNTSLMIVQSGDQRFEVRITSTEQKNAVVRFQYQKPKQ